MEIHQLKTFMTVAQEGTITRASEMLYLSQPAVSAHIKAMEESLGLTLFERTPKGMTLTSDGQAMLIKAEQVLDAHKEFLGEALKLKGRLSGTLTLGAAGEAGTEAMAKLITRLAEYYPDIRVGIRQGTSIQIQEFIRNGELDAGFYNDIGEHNDSLLTTEVSSFGIYLAAQPGFVDRSEPLNWSSLGKLPWICPSTATCCGRIAEQLFEEHGFRPAKIISIDNEKVTQTLITGGIGIGLLHENTVRQGQLNGQIELICEVQQSISVQFAVLKNKAHSPLLNAIMSTVKSITSE